MENSLMNKNILNKLERLKKFNGKINFKDKDGIVTLEKTYKKESWESEEIEYKLYLNNKLLLLKSEGYRNSGGYRWNKEEYCVLDGYIYNAIGTNTDLTFNKDGFIYSNDRVSGNNINYEVTDYLFVATLPFSLIKVYYNYSLKEVGIILNDKQYYINYVGNIEEQIQNIIDEYSIELENVKSNIKVLLDKKIFNKNQTKKCINRINNILDECLKINVTKNNITNIIKEIHNIKYVYANYLEYKESAEIILSHIYKIILRLENLLNQQEKNFLEEEYKKEYKELKKQLMKKYGFKDIE